MIRLGSSLRWRRVNPNQTSGIVLPFTSTPFFRDAEFRGTCGRGVLDFECQQVIAPYTKREAAAKHPVDETVERRLDDVGGQNTSRPLEFGVRGGYQ